MADHSVLTHRNVGVRSVAGVEAPEIVTSAWIDEQLAETYERNGLKPGILTDLAGIEARRWWPEDTTFEEVAARAGRAALDRADIDPDRVGVLINTSVCRHHLEPSVACAVHHALGLSPGCLNFDVGNACLGFIDGMQIASAMIDTGAVDYALIVDGEGSRAIQERTLERLRRPDATAADVFTEFASLTLGSGAAAAVLCRMDEHPDAHRLVGGVARSGTEHHRLCIGDLERMRTDANGLMVAGLDLAERTYRAAEAHFDWHAGMDHYVMHQVSQRHTELLCERLGIDPDRCPRTFPQYGNVGPAAVPITLAAHQENIEAGERVLCMGIGSGLNMNLTEILW